MNTPLRGFFFINMRLYFQRSAKKTPQKITIFETFFPLFTYILLIIVSKKFKNKKDKEYEFRY